MSHPWRKIVHRTTVVGFLAFLGAFGMAGTLQAQDEPPCESRDWACFSMDPVDEVPVHVSQHYEHGVGSPLLIYLHRYAPYGGSGVEEELTWTKLWPAGSDDYGDYIGMNDQVIETPEGDTGWIYALPNGAIDPVSACDIEDVRDLRYWNAFDDCCAFNYMGGGFTGLTPGAPDHPTYLNDLIRHLKSVYTIDPDRVYIMGFSAGGFLAHRMACLNGNVSYYAPHPPEPIAAIATLGGCLPTDLNQCQSVKPVNILTEHATGDQSVPYSGGIETLTLECWPDYPRAHAGALATIAGWLFLNRTSTDGEIRDSIIPLDVSVPYSIGENIRWSGGRDGAVVQHIRGIFGTHFINMSMNFRTFLVDWFLDHPRPGSQAPCTGDLDHDGIVSGADLNILLGDWGTDGIGDLDGSGIVDGADLTILLAHWGPCTR